MKSWIEGSALWSDFGGKVKEEVEECAARELYEETLGVLISKDDIPILAQSLKDEQYIFRVENTFLVKFDWKPSVLFEYSKIHFQIKSFEKILAGYPLSAAQRVEMCKYNWMQGRNDARLKKILEHGAIVKETRYMPVSVIEQANNNLNFIICATPAKLSGAPTNCTIIKGVKPQFLEKDVLELFSLEQLWCSLKSGGLCVKGQSIQLSSDFSQFLQTAKKGICMGLTDDSDCEVNCKY
jgi:hypothetical protein